MKLPREPSSLLDQARPTLDPLLEPLEGGATEGVGEDDVVVVWCVEDWYTDAGVARWALALEWWDEVDEV